jgi:predicted O-methyltransferase YrrM
MELPLDLATVKGFLDAEEARALYAAGLAEAERGPLLEIGSYCGKSAVVLGAAVKARGSVLFTVDHHRGSEENQPGWQYHDPELWDAAAESLDTLPEFRRTIRRAALEDTVIAIIGHSHTVARHWKTPLAMLFIDGGHSMAAALGDWRGWSPHLMQGGLIAIHDVFPDPADGGRPPYEIYRMALASGLYEEEGAVKSLCFLRRL